jgi:long-chain acyl-CoA synthetase
VRAAYGLTEASGVAALGVGNDPRPGTAGRAVPRGDLKLSVDGELLVRGPHVFVGYFKDEAASRHAVDPDGWLRTGDKATLERDGTLVISAS